MTIIFCQNLPQKLSNNLPNVMKSSSNSSNPPKICFSSPMCSKEAQLDRNPPNLATRIGLSASYLATKQPIREQHVNGVNRHDDISSDRDNKRPTTESKCRSNPPSCFASLHGDASSSSRGHSRSSRSHLNHLISPRSTNKTHDDTQIPEWTACFPADCLAAQNCRLFLASEFIKGAKTYDGLLGHCTYILKRKKNWG